LNPVDLARKRWKPVRKALEERERLEAELTQAGERLAALQGELQQAAQDDREAYAAAIAAGQDEPVRKVEQLAIRIEAEQRRVDACALAVERANDELNRLRGENRSAWHKDTLAKIAEAHGAYEESIRLLERCREALADEVALAGWISDGIGVSPIRDSLSGRTASVNGREPLSFSRVLRELDEDGASIASYLREIEPSSPWSLMKRAEALVGKGATREQALKQVGGWDG
jgi:tetratricopeptide (TPR) repeat protein